MLQFPKKGINCTTSSSNNSIKLGIAQYPYFWINPFTSIFLFYTSAALFYKGFIGLCNDGLYAAIKEKRHDHIWTSKLFWLVYHSDIFKQMQAIFQIILGVEMPIVHRAYNFKRTGIYWVQILGDCVLFCFIQVKMYYASLDFLLIYKLYDNIEY